MLSKADLFADDLDAGRGEVDAVYCLGDLVGYATWPNEVVTSIQERGIPTIALGVTGPAGTRAVLEAAADVLQQTDRPLP